MDRRFLGILAVIIVVFVVIFAITQSSGGNSSGNTNASPTHHVEGQGKSGVTLVEYGDYQCPVCEAYYQPLKDAVGQYSSQIYFQFRNLPLSPNPHPNAFAAARAAEAAGMQGKFWQMHDKLYENQDQWADASNPQTFYDQYAQQIGLNLTKFKQDYASNKVNASINADLAAFDKTGQQKATPTFFVNGKYVPNSDLVDAQSGAPTATSIGNFIKSEISKK